MDSTESGLEVSEAVDSWLIMFLQGKLEWMKGLIEVLDEELYIHLFVRLKLELHYYAIRWLTTLLSREFELPEVLQLWDFLFRWTQNTHRPSFTNKSEGEYDLESTKEKASGENSSGYDPAIDSSKDGEIRAGILKSKEEEIPENKAVKTIMEGTTFPDGSSSDHNHQRIDVLCLMCIAMVLLKRRDLLEGDFISNMSLLQSYPKVEIHHVLAM